MSDSNQPEPPTLNRLPSSIRRYVTGENFDRFLTVLFLVGLSAIPASVIVIVAILKHGHTTTFPPDDPHVSWVKGPDTRGTFNIIWLCATTIFTCVYVTVHVDVPNYSVEVQENEEEVTEPYVPSVFRRCTSAVRKCVSKIYRCILDAPNCLWRKIKPNLRKAYWVFLNIFAPELMLFVAFCERESAKSGVAFMHSCGQKKWKLRHAFFADMGGFKVKEPTRTPEVTEVRVFSSGLDFYEWYKNEGCPAVEYKEIEHDIKDKSKKDTLLKLFTIVQAAWFIIETLERFAQHQPVSALEVTTCSYIVCAIITQACWLRKPYGVNRSHTVPVVKAQTPAVEGAAETTSALRARSPIREALQETRTPSEIGDGASELEKHDAPTAPTLAPAADEEANKVSYPRLLFPKAPCTPFNRAYMNPRHSVLFSCTCACFVGVIVGFIHIIPFWNTRFVSTEGQWMWRACCGVQISVFLAFAFSAAIEPLYHGVLLWLSMLLLCLFYCMSRIVLFALIWTSFSSQPIGLYNDVHWGFALFPHWE
ncbi:hypothetical protein SCHPADRAFT_941901 [Schizopora paradoxa]|uniref:Uncharacterized protein n=1 Tax=Schizopora paradoxa TaxID=27342 RepID=A0A0H2RQ35_9AGAM|nr:hypothetical protein SCHPADRAFT_941901 [Schizopora paradoxa]